MIGRLLMATLVASALLSVVWATEVEVEVAVEVGTGATITSPNTGHEYVLMEEVEYSPRLRAAQEQSEVSLAFVERRSRSKARLTAHRDSRALNPEDWRLGPLIGRGGYGSIFKGKRKDGSGPFVAIKKVIIAHDGDAPTIRAEVEVQRKLVKLCPGLVVDVIDTWEQLPKIRGGERDLFLVMELMTGDIHAYTRHRGDDLKLGGDVPSALKLWTPMVRAVQCLHHNGYVHRDLKGPNFLIDDNGNVKVADFGETRTREQITTTGSRLMPHQTIVYNAPTAIRVIRDRSGLPHHEFTTTRTWDRFVSWDGYATGLTMLEVYMGKTVDVIAHRSSAPKMGSDDLLGLLEVFLKGFGGEPAYAAFMEGLNEAFGYAPLPAAIDELLKGLLLEQNTHTLDRLNTNGGPFTQTWTRDTVHNSWTGSGIPTAPAWSDAPSSTTPGSSPTPTTPASGPTPGATPAAPSATPADPSPKPSKPSGKPQSPVAPRHKPTY